MLLELFARNFALLEEVRVCFDRGLNILTGETGAGKSLIVGALEFILGGRARTEWIRAGADEVEVAASFDISANAEARRILAEAGYPEDEGLHLRRLLSRAGKNRVFVNDRPSTVTMLAHLAERLVDIHGQHEHQSLLKVATHQEVLDLFGDCLPLRKAVSELYSSLRKAKADLLEREESARRQRAEKDLMAYQLDELERARLAPSEVEELEAERRRLLNAEKLLLLCKEGEGILHSQRQSIGDQLGWLKKRIEEALEIDPALGALKDLVETAIAYVQEAALFLHDRAGRVHADQARLGEIEERLDLLHQLRRKYQCSTTEDLISKREEIRDRLAGLADSEVRLTDLREYVRAKEAELRARAMELSEARKRAAAALCRDVEKELHVLGMKKNRFRVAVDRHQPDSSDKGDEYLSIEDLDVSPTGIDRVEFLICTNPGEPYRPLHRIVSGGELSRIMLAIRNVLHQSEAPETLVFDEIDAGFGGAEADIVGARLKGLASSFQVLCITHLPQIAAFADTHIKVSKHAEKDRTEIQVKTLDVRGRELEIARMLAGRKITPKVLEHAREVLARRDGGHR